MSTESSTATNAPETTTTAASRPADDLRQQIYNSPKERAIKYVLGACALVSVLTTLGIAAVLVIESIPFFQSVALGEFFGDTRWTPQFANKHFGIWALLSGTVLVTVISAVVALPVGLASAIYISEYATDWVRQILKPGLELLAGVPTVVYGYFALTFVTPLLQTVIPGLGVYNALSGGIVVGIMIIPMVASLSEDALQAVPDSLGEAAYALGATKFETVLSVNVPAAFSGIMASFILAVSRAIGETMIVTLAAGATPKMTLDPTQSIQTMTAFIVQVSKGDTPQGTIVYQSIFAVGLVLFLITLAMNILANRITRRYQEKY
ncbi:phosphate ABC transporter permease subunit PstC [Salinibacter sp. 10B]|uniref:phosphate ABC transporter permease subunit PstC n=1 Tax=Salinibacter sp. 10B TaxID=1923971 RepID=UPI000CF42A36|nr:phosphate ABC transporter permease subunit PstC [Salinibacter sp. 10B]PQJ34843.1 phosphate ABC transporter permease subunit PstC [Salinibacter sp. 10B]